MKTHKWKDLRERRLTPEQRAATDAWVEKELLELSLADLRKEIGVTQVELAAAAESSQAELSRTEQRRDHLLSTLRRYVEALGGELEVRAIFGSKQVKLKGV